MFFLYRPLRSKFLQIILKVCERIAMIMEYNYEVQIRSKRGETLMTVIQRENKWVGNVLWKVLSKGIIKYVCDFKEITSLFIQ